MILFVCSQGRIRSRTAEVLALLGGLNARCCGTDDTAMVPVNDQLLLAARQIVCMEQSHAELVRPMEAAEGKVIVSLGIRDVWNPFDPMLCEQIVRLAPMRLGSPEIGDALKQGFALMQAQDIASKLFLGGA